jgi:hypothetical protein
VSEVDIIHDLAISGKKRYERAAKKERAESRRRRIKRRRTIVLNSWKKSIDFPALFKRMRIEFNEHTGKFELPNGKTAIGSSAFVCPVTGSLACKYIEGIFTLTRMAYVYHHKKEPDGFVFQVDNDDPRWLPASNLRVETTEKEPKKRSAASSKPIPAKRTKKVARQRTGDSRVTKFRQEMNLLGIVQAGFQIPKDAKQEITLFCDGKRAEYYLRIVELATNDRRRLTLADRNKVTIPTYTEMARLKDDIPIHLSGELKPHVRAMDKHVAETLRAQGALQAIESEDERVKWNSIAVAHSHAAKYHRDFIEWSLDTYGKQAQVAS